MKINNKILEIFKEFSIRQEDGICYLISLYYGYKPTYIPELLQQKVNATGIIVSTSSGIDWKIPLFQDQETAFEWVKTEYEPLFKETNPKKCGKVREATVKMKDFFAKNPEYRKEDILGATKMYLNNTDAFFIRFPHYFIEKGKGVDKISDLYDWLQKYSLVQKDEESNNHTLTTTMQ